MNFVKQTDGDHEDIDFIEEIVIGYQQDLDLQEKIYTMIENALDNNSNLTPEDKDEILNKVETHQDDFVKLLTYAGFLLESIKSTKTDL